MRIAVFGDPQQPILVAGTVLSGGESERSRHLPTIGKLIRMTHSRDQRRGNHRSHTADLLQPFSIGIVLGDRLDLLVEFGHAAIQRLQILP